MTDEPPTRRERLEAIARDLFDQAKAANDPEVRDKLSGQALELVMIADTLED